MYKIVRNKRANAIIITGATTTVCKIAGCMSFTVGRETRTKCCEFDAGVGLLYTASPSSSSSIKRFIRLTTT